MRSYMTDHRTPLAWRHRDMQSPRPHPGHHHHHHHHHPPRPPATPSVTTTSSDEREEVPMVRNLPHRRPNSRPNSRGTNRYTRDGHSQFSAAEPYHGTMLPFRSGGTLRSTRSVPALALATWDGEPCPVHGHGLPLFHHQHPQHPHYHPLSPSNAGTMRRHGSLFDLRPPFPMGPPFHPPGPPMFPPPHPQLLEKKSFHGSLQMMPPYHLMPPMMRPRPFVIPAEPLPIRDPFKMRTPPASGYAGSGKADDPYASDQVCCKGHLIVLWIILAVVTIGVILGIVLGVTIA